MKLIWVNGVDTLDGYHWRARQQVEKTGAKSGALLPVH